MSKKESAVERLSSRELSINGYTVLQDTVTLQEPTLPERRGHFIVSGFMVVEHEFPVGFQAWKDTLNVHKNGWFVPAPYSLTSCFPIELSIKGKKQLQASIGELSEKRRTELEERTKVLQEMMMRSSDTLSSDELERKAKYLEAVTTVADHIANQYRNREK